ncbi:MAG: hypothetical protein M1837_004093 [Sclerophora amabilis]|nr:MAG: hypothetical protein M1837_004093 [Sclerophora amabilis]
MFDQSTLADISPVLRVVSKHPAMISKYKTLPREAHQALAAFIMELEEHGPFDPTADPQRSTGKVFNELAQEFDKL